MSHKQDQHKVPQVYLKKFGYKNNNNQWKVAVIKRGETFTREKSIESFTAITNIFDIPSDDERVRRAFEDFNCDLENEYNIIIDDLNQVGKLSDKSYVYLVNTIANFICRSDYWRRFILGILQHENKEPFLHFILGHNCKTPKEFQELPNQPFFKELIQLSAEDGVNRVLIFFADYLLFRLKHFEIVLLKSQPNKPWFTSTNPVILHNRKDYKHREIFAKESEVYLPLSPDYLAYLHFRGSADKRNKLRTYDTNVVHLATDKQNRQLQRTILKNRSDYLIFAGEFKHRATEDLFMKLRKGWWKIWGIVSSFFITIRYWSIRKYH